MDRHSTKTYSFLSALAAGLRSMSRRVCQCMNATPSQKAVVTNASEKYSQAKASPRMSNQRRQAKTAGMDDGEVRTKLCAAVRNWLISDVGMAVVAGVVGLAALLADGFASTVFAIALSVCVLVVLVAAWKCAGKGVQ